MITFNEFLDKVDDTFLDHQAARSNGKIKAENQWRYGQTVMNVLWEVWPEKYQEIKGGDCDCFYQNSVVESALNKLEKEWVV
jgi:hypothetical protein